MPGTGPSILSGRPVRYPSPRNAPGRNPGPHLALPDAEESQRTLIWLADVQGDRVAVWTLVEDTPEQRAALGLEI